VHTSSAPARGCSTFTEVIITDPAHPYVVGIRLTVEDDEISEIEALVTDEGDWAFSAQGYLNCSEPEDWGPLPENERSSREVVIAAGNAYFDYFEDKSVQVPWDTSSCSRLEGGNAFSEGQFCQYSGEASGNYCDMGVPDDTRIGARRAYADVEIGAVVIICLFGGDSFGMLDSHMFRVESGRIHYIHTLTIDGDQGSGTGW
jgi:hypothetical protein